MDPCAPGARTAGPPRRPRLSRLLAAHGLRGWIIGCLLVLGGVCAAGVFNAAWVLLKPASFQAFRWERQRLDGIHEMITYAVQTEGYGSEQVTLFDRHCFPPGLLVNHFGPIPGWPSVHSFDVEYREPRDAYRIVVFPSWGKQSSVFDVMHASAGPWRPWVDAEYVVAGVGGGYMSLTPRFIAAPGQLIGPWWSPQRVVIRWRAVAFDLLVPVTIWSAIYLSLRAIVLWRRSRRGVCWRCAYPVPAQSRCPECGSLA